MVQEVPALLFLASSYLCPRMKELNGRKKLDSLCFEGIELDLYLIGEVESMNNIFDSIYSKKERLLM